VTLRTRTNRTREEDIENEGIDGDDDVRVRRRKAAILYAVACQSGIEFSFPRAATLLRLEAKTADSLRKRLPHIQLNMDERYRENRDWLSPMLGVIQNHGVSADGNEDPPQVTRFEKADKAAEINFVRVANDPSYTHEKAAKDAGMDGDVQDQNLVGKCVRKLNVAAGNGDDGSR